MASPFNSGPATPGLTSSNPLTTISTSVSAPVHGEPGAARRRVLSVVIGCLLQEAGCVSVEKAVVATLVEILQSTIVDMGRLSRGYCELAYRTEPLGADIILALADMGINTDGLHMYSRRSGRSIVPPIQVQQDTKQHSILQVGDKKAHLPHIPDNLPAFPDTHTYCFTPTVKQPVTEYEAIREKAATQKRDIERALTKFFTKTNATESLFIAEDKDFSLVCMVPTASQNIDALMPKDQVFEAELDYEVSKARKKRHDRLSNFQHQQQQLKQETGETEQELKYSDTLEGDTADNPYLQAVKAPRVSLTTGGSRELRHDNSHHHHYHHQQQQPQQQQHHYQHPAAAATAEAVHHDPTAALHATEYNDHRTQSSYNNDRVSSNAYGNNVPFEYDKNRSHGDYDNALSTGFDEISNAYNNMSHEYNTTNDDVDAYDNNQAAEFGFGSEYNNAASNEDRGGFSSLGNNISRIVLGGANKRTNDDDRGDLQNESDRRNVGIEHNDNRLTGSGMEDGVDYRAMDYQNIGGYNERTSGASHDHYHRSDEGDVYPPSRSNNLGDLQQHHARDDDAPRYQHPIDGGVMSGGTLDDTDRHDARNEFEQSHGAATLAASYMDDNEDLVISPEPRNARNDSYLDDSYN